MVFRLNLSRAQEHHKNPFLISRPSLKRSVSRIISIPPSSAKNPKLAKLTIPPTSKLFLLLLNIAAGNLGMEYCVKRKWNKRYQNNFPEKAAAAHLLSEIFLEDISLRQA